VAKVFQFATLASGVVPFLFYAFQVPTLSRICYVFTTTAAVKDGVRLSSITFPILFTIDENEPF